jgi:hypothetical protein
MQSSLFRSVTRYPVTFVINQRENRLTEVTAAVLDRVQGLPRTAVAQLLAGGLEDAERRSLPPKESTRRAELRSLVSELVVRRVEISTQVATSSGHYVDLELLLRGPIGAEEPGLLVWVEIKHGAGLSGNQLDWYVRDIELRPVPEAVERAVVLLVPRGESPDGDVPATVLITDWQGLARAIHPASLMARSAEESWLLSEYIRYLKEEALSDPDGLTAVSALALMEARTASDAVTGICQYAGDLVSSAWGGAPKKYRTAGYGLGYYAGDYPHGMGAEASPTWRGAWLEWGLRDALRMPGLEEPRGNWAFMSGLSFYSKDDPTKRKGNVTWIGERAAEGFTRFSVDGFGRFAVLRYPDQLLNHTTLEQQGRAVGQWILDVFNKLAGAPPPA